MAIEDSILMVAAIVLSVVGSSYTVGNMISKRIDDLRKSLCDNLHEMSSRIERLERKHFKI